MLRLRTAVSPLVFALAGCHGLVAGQDPGPNTAPSTAPDASVATAPDAGPARCEPAGSAVPKLLRLSNHEYRNMVSDLLGAPVDEALFARWTPVAEVWGFDTMSETRVDQQALEEQLATAEALAQLLLASPAATAHCPAPPAPENPPCEVKAEYSSREDFSDVQGRACWSYLDSTGTPMVFVPGRALWRKEPDETAFLWRDGAHPGSTVDVVRRWQSPLTGSVFVTGHFADADADGGDGVLVSVRHQDRNVFVEDLPNGGATSFELRFDVALGDRVDFVVNRKRGPEWDTTAFGASIQLSTGPRKTAWDWERCAAPLVTRLGSRAFRRPLRAEELADYRTLFEDTLRGATTAGFAEPADEALAALVQAVLLSPNLVFKPELVPGGVDEAERSYAVASRLGLFFRSSLPDEALWRAAESGELGDPAALRAQAARLLELDGRRFALHFGGQWLAFREPALDPLAESIRAEARDVFTAVLSEGMTPDRLLLPGFTVIDDALALHYGLTAEGRGPHRLITEERGGLLSQAAFLLPTGSGSEFRRPIHRGLWVLTRLLCRSLPRLDPATREEISESFGTIDPTLPLPEQMALHRDSSTRCGGCHAHIDPIGLALEKYDPRGIWRDHYASGAPIVTELELSGTRVRDPHELARVIAGSAEYRACVANKLFTFALSRGPRDDERCVAQQLARGSGDAPPSLEAIAIDAFLKGLELTEVSR